MVSDVQLKILRHVAENSPVNGRLKVSSFTADWPETTREAKAAVRDLCGRGFLLPDSTQDLITGLSDRGLAATAE
jgi:hypothetical protein